MTHADPLSVPARGELCNRSQRNPTGRSRRKGMLSTIATLWATFMDTLSLIGNLASIISLVIALLAWKTAKDVEKRFRQEQSVRTGLAVNSPVNQVMNSGEANRH